MLRLGRFPIDLMMQSVAYMVQDVPAIAPSPGEPPCFITEFRMSMDDHHTFPSRSASCHIDLWLAIAHILPYLTSLHTLGPTEFLEYEFSDLVLAYCRSLKRLHYYGNSVVPLYKYMASQPQLEAFGVLVPAGDVQSEQDWINMIGLIHQLQHRPKILSVRPWLYHIAAQGLENFQGCSRHGPETLP
jgi:hypothetical protein